MFVSQYCGNCIFLRTCLCLLSWGFTYTHADVSLAKDSRGTFSTFGELFLCIALSFWEVCPANSSHLNFLECQCWSLKVSEIARFFLDSSLCTIVWMLPSCQSLECGRMHLIYFPYLRNPGLWCLLFSSFVQFSSFFL